MKKNGIIVSFTIDEPEVSINYNKKKIDAPAAIVNDRTLVPVRALAEGFGVTVDWDADTRTVILKNNDTTATITDFVVADDSYSTYIGQVADGVPEGYGTGYLKKFTDIYFVGYWEEGQPVSGRIYSTDSSYGFVGFASFGGGIIRGYSEITIPSGETYHGNWENNMMNGYGELYMTDGSYYKGEFKDNAMRGYGELYDAATGMSLEGNWENGELISEQ